MRLPTVRLVALLALALLMAPRAAEAQKPVKAPRIGLLMAHPAGTPPYLGAFYQELCDLGYVEGILPTACGRSASALQTMEVSCRLCTM